MVYVCMKLCTYAYMCVCGGVSGWTVAKPMMNSILPLHLFIHTDKVHGGTELHLQRAHSPSSFHDNFDKCRPIFIIFFILSLSLSVLMAIFQVNLVNRCLLKQRMMEVVVTMEL